MPDDKYILGDDFRLRLNPKYQEGGRGIEGMSGVWLDVITHEILDKPAKGTTYFSSHSRAEHFKDRYPLKKKRGRRR